MAVDKVQPLKTESVAGGGDGTDEFPTALSPQLDHVEAAGLVINDASNRDESTRIWRVGSDMMFKDTLNSGGVTLTQLLAGSGAIFGSNFQQQVVEATSSTTSSTFQDKVTLTTPALTGTFRVAYYIELTASSGEKDSASRLYNVTDAVELCTNWVHRTYSGGAYVATAGFYFVMFTGAAKTFKVQFSSPDGNTTITARRARIELWRVS